MWREDPGCGVRSNEKTDNRIGEGAEPNPKGRGGYKPQERGECAKIRNVDKEAGIGAGLRVDERSQPQGRQAHFPPRLDQRSNEHL
jgi:hypothetical protein